MRTLIEQMPCSPRSIARRRVSGAVDDELSTVDPQEQAGALQHHVYQQVQKSVDSDAASSDPVESAIAALTSDTPP